MIKHFIYLVSIVLLLGNAHRGIAQSTTNELYINTIASKDSLYSKTFEEQKQFWVQLPENYNPNSSEKYPVVYILDGKVLLKNLETVYENYLGHYLPHMILVGISNQTNRTRDLTTSQIKMRHGAKFNQDTGGAEKFTKYIENELIPYIDKTYPTTNYRTLIGHSYAGLFTINMLINHNSFFKNYIAIDPSLDWDNQKLLKQAQEKLVSENFKEKSLFVSMSAEQLHMWDETVTVDNLTKNTSEFTLFPRSIVAFSNFVESHKESGLNFAWNVYPEDLHMTVPLPSMRDGLVFLFNWFQFKNPPKYNNPETTVEELTELLNKQEKIYAKNFGYSVPPMIEELFNGYGYMNMQMGAPKKAKLFFEMGVKYYPKSANSYDSLAEYYESQNDIPNAIKYVSKAYDLSGNKSYKERLKRLQTEK
ncbi:MAG: esterase [Lutibacter sp.]|uniref:alpha/beta hydrolase-fold protein n=1 Tax=Lutibacter sp. TaxID=1925666 RepID=UPI001A0392FC|nr:alpha/beta hydrolase-fold protein [Lutibacter sp.]NOR27184.1 esterase [Lutibacter sp.]